MSIDAEKAYLRSVQCHPVTWVPGFDRNKHRVPDRVHVSADTWVRTLFEESVRAETQKIYQNAKLLLGLVRDEVERSAAEGAGSVETASFWFSIDSGQDPEDPAQVRTVRTLRLNVPPAALPREFDSLFPVSFQEVVLPLLGEPDFDDLVRKFEAYASKTGGEVIEEEDHARIRYLSKTGWEWIVRLNEKELILRPGKYTGCLHLIHCVTEYFAPPAPHALARNTPV